MATNEMRRLQNRIDAGIATEGDVARFKALQTQAPPVEPAGRTRPRAPRAPAVSRVTTLYVDSEVFRSGIGGGFFAPQKEGWYPALCTEVMVPDFVEDQAWLLFRSEDGATEAFNGALVMGNLSRSREERGGSWKLAQVLAELGMDYSLDEDAGTLTIPAFEPTPCHVLWQTVDIKGKRELRIQNVRRGAVVESI